MLITYVCFSFNWTCQAVFPSIQTAATDLVLWEYKIWTASMELETAHFDNIWKF